jgi:hypothetical protein
MKAKKTESRSRLAKPPKAIKWKSSEVYHLRSMLAHVQSKLDRIHVLGPRLAVEAPEMPVGDLISRLRKRKKELIKKISEEDEKTLKKPRSGGSFKQGGSAGRHVWLPPPDLMDAWLRSKMDTLEGKTIIPFSGGVVEPAYFSHRRYQKLRLHHKSCATYHAFEISRYPHGFSFEASLRDDAAWHRDDNPDSASWGSQTGYSIPPPDHDAVVHLNVSVELYSKFTNAADDGGLLVNSVVIEHTNPAGHWPGSLNWEVEPNQVVFLSTKKTGSYDSGPRTFHFDLETKQGASQKIAILLVTHLSAQDGRVDVDGLWWVSSQVYYYFTRT